MIKQSKKENIAYLPLYGQMSESEELYWGTLLDGYRAPVIAVETFYADFAKKVKVRDNTVLRDNYVYFKLDKRSHSLSVMLNANTAIKLCGNKVETCSDGESCFFVNADFKGWGMYYTFVHR